MGDDDGLIREVGKFQGRDERDVPKQRVVIDLNALKCSAQGRQWSSPSFKVSLRRNTPKLDCIASCIWMRISPGFTPPLLRRIPSKR